MFKTITVTWHTVENADWYLFYRLYFYDSLGITEAESVYFTGTTGITVTRSGSVIPYNGLLDVVGVARPDRPTTPREIMSCMMSSAAQFAASLARPS
jgi:hypothetical protein